jgi:hypothetical protein
LWWDVAQRFSLQSGAKCRKPKNDHYQNSRVHPALRPELMTRLPAETAKNAVSIILLVWRGRVISLNDDNGRTAVVHHALFERQESPPKRPLEAGANRLILTTSTI